MKRQYRVVTNGKKFRVQSRLCVFGRPLWWRNERRIADNSDMAVLYEEVEFSTHKDASEWVEAQAPDKWQAA